MSTVPAVEAPSATETFAGLYERNADRIFGYCRRRLRTRQEAEDAVQETFLSAMRAIKRGSVPVSESAWLFKIAENVCFAVYRSGARRHARDLSDSERMERLAAPDGGGDTLFGLEEALDTLPPNQRHAFVLRELRGLSYKEIAIQLGVSVASVETLIYRARRGLAKALESGAGLRGRLTASLNAGSLIASVKGWLAGATAVKFASAAAVVAVASIAAGGPPQQPQARERPSGSRAPEAPSARVQTSVLWGARQSGAGTTVTPTSTPSRAARQPRPRPEPRQPRPADLRGTPASGGAVPEVMPAARPTEPVPTPPAPLADAAPQPPVSVPPAPQLPVVGSVTVPELPLPVVEIPPVVELPPLPVDVPDVGELLPGTPLLP